MKQVQLIPLYFIFHVVSTTQDIKGQITLMI